MGEGSATGLSNLDEKVEAEKLIQMLLLHSDVEGSVSSDPSFSTCVNNLSHLRLDELAAMPKRIQMEEDSIRHKTEQLAVENYPIFLANANTSRDVHREFLSISESSVNLLSSIAGVSSAAQAIFDNIGKNASAFRVSANLVQKYTQILDFLELPQLMDTCIQNGYCQDALNILSHTKGMAKKYGRMVPIVRMVGLQTQEISGQLFSQLCKKLREPITLPVCLKVLIYLRQFEAFTEQELRLNFLQARGMCIKDQLEFALAKPLGLASFDSSSTTKLAHISGHQQAEYRAFIRAMRRIEVTRVHLFDSITQYRAVFADEEAYSSKPNDAHQQPVLADLSPLHLDETALALRCLTTSGIDFLGPSTEASLFHSWLVHQVGVFLDGLSGDLSALLNLPHLTPSEISDRIQLAMANDSITLDSADAPTTFQQIHSVMTQALYFGRSFARIGCDFRPHLGAIFSREILAYFEALLTNALTELSVTLELWPWELSEPPFATNQQEGTGPDEISAPMAIASHPPIAFFCNRLLTAFNGLRVCCPVGLRDGVLSASTRILSSAAETIVAAHKSRQLDSTAARAQSANLASVFVHVAVPHILSCLLEYVFGGDAAAHLWQLHLEGQEEAPSTSQTVSLLTRRVCAPIFMVWGQLTTGPLRIDDTVKQSVIPDIDEVRPTSDAHLSLLTTALEKHQPLEFQHEEEKVLASLAEECDDLSTVKEAPHSVELSLPQKKDVEYKSKVVAAHSAEFIPGFEVRKNESDVLVKPNPSVLVKEVDLGVASSFSENDGFPPNVSEDLKTVRLDSPAPESVKHPLSSTDKITIRGADYTHFASVQESKPETVSSTLPMTRVDESNSQLGNWPHEEIRKEVASCHLTEPNQEEVVHEDVEALPINPVPLSTYKSKIQNCTAPEVTVPPALRGVVKDAQGDNESDEVIGETVAVMSSKVVAAAIAKDYLQFSNIATDESGQQDVERHAGIEAVDKLSLDAHRPAETIIMDGNTAAESQFINQHSTLSETEGDQSDYDAASQPYHSHLLLKENQPSIQDKEKHVQSVPTSHDLTAEAPEVDVVGSKLALSNDIPDGGDFSSTQKTSPFIEESDSFKTRIRDEAMTYPTSVLGVPDVVNEPADWADEKSGGDGRTLIGHLTTTGDACVSTVSGEHGTDIQANHESLLPTCDRTNFPNHDSTTQLPGKERSTDKDNSTFLSDLGGSIAGELSASEASSVPAMVAICSSFTLGRPDAESGRANWIAGGYALGELDDSGHAESVNANSQDIGHCEEGVVTIKEDNVVVNIAESKLKEREATETVATDMQSPPLVGRAMHRGSTEGEAVEVDNGNAWVKDVDVGVGELKKQVILHSPNPDTSSELALNEENAEKELCADSEFEVDVKLSANENADVAGIGNLMELTVVDQKIEAGDEFEDWEGGCEADGDRSDFASLPNLGMDVQSIYQRQLETKKSDLSGTDDSENIHRRPEVLEEDAFKSQTLIASGKSVTKPQQPQVDELASGVSAGDRSTFAEDSDARGKGSLKANVDWGDYADISVIHEEKCGILLSKDSGGSITQFTSATELIEQNNEAASESEILVSEAGSVIATGPENLVQLPILDRASGNVDNADGGFADWKGECEVDKDPSDSTTIPAVHGLTEIGSHGADTKNAYFSQAWKNQDKQSSSDATVLYIGQTGDKSCPSSRRMHESESLEPSSPRDSAAFLTSDVVASHRIKSADFDELCGSQNIPEKLALFDVDWNDNDNLWDEDADIDITDEGKSYLHADEKPVEPDSNLVQRSAEGELDPGRKLEIDAQSPDVFENLLMTKNFDAENLEKETSKAKISTPLNEWKIEVESVEADELNLQEETSSNAGTSVEKRPEAEHPPLSEKPQSNNDWGEDADISVNVTQKYSEIGRSKSDCALTEKADCEMEGLSTMHIPSAPPFSNANTSQSGTTYFLRTVVDYRQEKRLAAEDAVASMPCIVLEPSSVHSEPSEIQTVEADRLKGVNANLRDSSEGLVEAKLSDAANGEGWDVEF
ncbi:Conserved oligomeric Golgi complex subunit 8 [Taenia solium]|eukprot:TsM_001018200 transcript=TsM_001018200 gene=TsM_001018200